MEALSDMPGGGLRLARPGFNDVPGLRYANPGYKRVASKSPVALPLTGATALCDLVARRRRNAPPPGKSLATINAQATGDKRFSGLKKLPTDNSIDFTPQDE